MTHLDPAEEAELADRKRREFDAELARMARAALLVGLPLEPTGPALELAQLSYAAELRAQAFCQAAAATGGAQ